MIKKYIKKPVVIEAIQWTGQNPKDIDEFIGLIGDTILRSSPHYIPGWHYQIKTLEGIMEAAPGDFIIKGIKGEFYPCKPDIFEQTYEIVE